MKTNAAFCLLLVASLLFIGDADAAVSCGVVASKGAACVGFAMGKVPRPPQACCAGLQQLAHEAVTVVDRRAICTCLENAVKAFPGVQDRFLGQIPRMCGIKVGFPVSLNTNCARIN